MAKSKKRKKYKVGKRSVDPNVPIFAQEDPMISVYAVVFVIVLSVVCGFMGTHLYSTGVKTTQVKCAKRAPTFQRCSIPTCQRVVIDNFLSDDDVTWLRSMFSRALSIQQGSGPVSILELQSGALSMEDKFVDIHAFMSDLEQSKKFQPEEMEKYVQILQKVRSSANELFGVSKTHYTQPIFFSQITADKPVKQDNDEYWHEHIDTLQYGAADITVLIYLSDQGSDFEGGDFKFTSTPEEKITPSRGKALFFTSDKENKHHITRVTNGVRYAFTILLTCDSAQQLDFSFLKKYDVRLPSVKKIGSFYTIEDL